MYNVKYNYTPGYEIQIAVTYNTLFSNPNQARPQIKHITQYTYLKYKRKDYIFFVDNILTRNLNIQTI